MVRLLLLAALVCAVGCSASHEARPDAGSRDGGADGASHADAARALDGGVDSTIPDAGPDAAISDAGATCKPSYAEPGSRWVDDGGYDWQWCVADSDCDEPGEHCLHGICCSGEVSFPGCACTCPGDEIGLVTCREYVSELCCYGRGIGPRPDALVCRGLDDCAASWADLH